MKERSLEPQPQHLFNSLEIATPKSSLANKGKLISIALLILALGFVVGRNFSSTDTQTESITSIVSPKVNVLPVKTVKIEPVSSYQTTQTFTGDVAALRTSEVGFELGGKIVAIAVDEGDRIKKGQTIAQLDTATLQARRQGLVAQKSQAQAVLAELKNGARDEQIASAKARVKELERQVELAQIRNKRREYLYAEGAIAQEQLDEVAFNRQALQERLRTAQSDLAELANGTRIERITAQQAAIALIDANLAELDLQINKSILKAPFAGVVAKRNFDEGTVVTAGSSLVRLVESDRLKVKVGIPASALRAIKIGSSQLVLINNQEYAAVVSSLLPEIDPNTRTRSLVLNLETTSNRQVAPGDIARLALTQTSSTEGYWLPIKAVSKSDRGLWSCYSLVTNDAGESVVERQYLEILATEAERVLVKGTITPGDLIVTEGIHRLIPGQKVFNKS